jgi:hypothetical protein
MKQELRLIGFNYTKINVERDQKEGKISLKSALDIKEIKKSDIEALSLSSINVKFSFSLEYENLGSILLEGIIALTGEKEFLEEIEKQWKDKKLSDDLKMIILNLIMQKCSLKALELEDEFNLPYHIQIPKLSLGKQDKEKSK